MKAKEFNRISKQFYNNIVRIIFYDDSEFVGSFKYPYKTFPLIPVGEEMFDIKDIKAIKLFEDDTLYKYVQVEYMDFGYSSTYSYKTTIEDIKIGDTVLVDCNGNEVLGTVKSIDLYTCKNAPFQIYTYKVLIL